MIESKPLTAEQSLSVVADEDATLVLAGAGSGKSTLTILASNARPSAFVTELVKDPAYGIVHKPGPDQEVHECGECGGRLLSVQGQDGRTWYRCEHSEHCGNFLPVQNAAQPYRGA